MLFYAKNSQAQFWPYPQFELCKPSSCGKITNITNPFRLPSDPAYCGTTRAELVCDNATTFLYLDSGAKYRVEEINYKAYSFRVVDVGLIADNYSSMPLYSSVELAKNGHYYVLAERDVPHVVAFLNCDEPVNSTIYLDIGARVKGKYSYILMGGVTVMDVANSCMLEKVVPIVHRHKRGVADARKYSYKDAHNAMAYGFELHFPYEYEIFNNIVIRSTLTPTLEE